MSGLTRTDRIVVGALLLGLTVLCILGIAEGGSSGVILL